MENTNPKSFTNVRVFAGDKSKPAANASYRNLLWENFHVDHSFNIGTKIQRNKEIGTIDSWGPFFRVSFDLIIHSLDNNIQWSSVISFFYDTGTGKILPLPAILLHSSGFLELYNDFFGNTYGSRRFPFKIGHNHWYNIIIEQKSVRGKVIGFHKISLEHLPS